MRLDHWSFYWVTILGILSVLAIPRPKRFAYLLPLAYLWTADVRLGLTWNGFKVVALAYMISMAGGLLPAGRRIPRTALLVLHLLYVLGISIFGVLNVPPDIPFLDVLYSDVQRPPYRQILQVVLWIASMLSLFMAFRGISSADDFARCLRVIFASVAVAAIVGAVLFALFAFAPAVSRLLAGFLSYPESVLQGRIAPFSYEPRYYGRAISIAACLVILCKVFPLSGLPSWASKSWAAIALVLLTLLTFSVSTSGAAALGWVVVFAWLVSSREPASLSRGSALAATGIGSGNLCYPGSIPCRKRGKTRGQLTTTRFAAKAQRSYSRGLIIVFSLLVIVLILLFLFNVPLQERVDFYLRTSGIYISTSSVHFRPVEEGRWDWNAYMRWFATEPEYLIFGAGLGNAAFRAYPYLSSTSPWLRLGYLRARLPFLEGLGNLGLIGMGMMLLLYYLWWRDLDRISKQCPPQEYYSIQICRGMVIFLVVSSLFQDTFTLVWFFLGAGFGCGSVCKIGRSKQGNDSFK